MYFSGHSNCSSVWLSMYRISDLVTMRIPFCTLRRSSLMGVTLKTLEGRGVDMQEPIPLGNTVYRRDGSASYCVWKRFLCESMSMKYQHKCVHTSRSFWRHLCDYLAIQIITTSTPSKCTETATRKMQFHSACDISSALYLQSY